MKKIAILLVFIMAVATAIEPIDAKPRRSSSRRSSSSFSRSIKRSTSSSYKKSTVDSGTSSTSKKSTTSSDKSTTSNDSNIDSGDYTVKKKTSETISNIIPSLYKNYSRNRYYRRGSNINFWRYYGLYHLFDDDDDEISEAELVRNLEEQGYTEEEIEQILADASLEEYDDIEDEEYIEEYEEDTEEAGKSFSVFRIIAFGLGGLILIAGVVIFIISMINRKSM